MPFAGLGLHILVALFFAVHAVRNGQALYWLVILFMFPLLGSVVYFAAVYLPNTRMPRGAHQAARAAVRALDPGKALREARADFEATPTAQHQMRLADAQLEAGQAEAAADTYNACLQGPFASDLEIRYGAARANLASGRATAALQHLDFIRQTNVAFRAEQISLLRAQALAAAERPEDAKAEFEFAVQRFGSFECHAEFAIWAANANEHELLARLRAELQRSMQRWTRQTRTLHKPLLQRLERALPPGQR